MEIDRDKLNTPCSLSQSGHFHPPLLEAHGVQVQEIFSVAGSLVCGPLRFQQLHWEEWSLELLSCICTYLPHTQLLVSMHPFPERQLNKQLKLLLHCVLLNLVIHQILYTLKPLIGVRHLLLQPESCIFKCGYPMGLTKGGKYISVPESPTFYNEDYCRRAYFAWFFLILFIQLHQPKSFPYNCKKNPLNS